MYGSVDVLDELASRVGASLDLGHGLHMAMNHCGSIDIARKLLDMRADVNDQSFWTGLEHFLFICVGCSWSGLQKLRNSYWASKNSQGFDWCRRNTAVRVLCCMSQLQSRMGKTSQLSRQVYHAETGLMLRNLICFTIIGIYSIVHHMVSELWYIRNLSSSAATQERASPLMFALLSTRYEAAAFLIAAGARLDLRNSRGWSAAEFVQAHSVPDFLDRALAGMPAQVAGKESESDEHVEVQFLGVPGQMGSADNVHDDDGYVEEAF